jgi:hypothetical protein
VKGGTKVAVILVVVLASAVVLLIVRHNYRKANSAQPHTVAAKALAPERTVQAREAAKDFLQAMKNGDWKSVSAFWPANAPEGNRFGDLVTDRMKSYIEGLEIVSLGTPHQDNPDSWVLVPYEVRFKDGSTRTNSLRLGQDSHGRWRWEGGF